MMSLFSAFTKVTTPNQAGFWTNAMTRFFMNFPKEIAGLPAQEKAVGVGLKAA